MEIKPELKYTKDHEWVRVEENIAIVGKSLSLEYFNENGDGVYPMTVEIVGKGSIFDPDNKRVRL